MKKITVNLRDRSYNIIAADSFALLPECLRKLNLGNYACIITNSKIKHIFEKQITTQLNRAGIKSFYFIVKDAETSKSLKTTQILLKKILKIDKKKKLFIAALGGGVIGDLAGFVAAIYKRGLPLIQIPTTLLAQVDSAIGGKVAVDVSEAKNIIGAFYQPRLVYSNIAALESLPVSEIKSGLAEIIKYGMIKDKELFEFLEQKIDSLINKEQEILEKVIFRCVQIKAKIVEQDEREKKGKRTVLNFGHTFGHAIETASAYSKKFTHGQAIAVGMLIACDLAEALSLCPPQVTQRLENIIKKTGLPYFVKGLKLGDILSALRHDKKFVEGKNRFVLPLEIGKVKIITDVNDEKIKQACLSRLKNEITKQ